MSGTAVSATSGTDTVARHHRQSTDRLVAAKGITPLRVHLLSLLVGVAILAAVDRNVWFFGDDWDFLLDRGLHHPIYSIWVPHNEHWSTLPILLFRAVVSIDGMHSVAPTLAVLLIAHLGICHLLWRISLGAGVDPWVATALAAIFVVLGSGAEDLTWDFQMGFVGSVLFGLLAIQADRLALGRGARLGLTWILLVCSLMCSGIGITMTVACTADRALRAGLRRAALTAVVPAAVYLVWYAVVGRTGLKGDHVTLTSILEIPTYLWTGLSSALGTTLGFSAAGPLAVLLLAGWGIRNAVRRRTGQATPLALAGATVILFIVIGLVRTDLGVQEATASRYAYIAIALLLPAIGLALSDLIQGRGRESKPVLYGLLAIVLVANLSSLRTFAQGRTALDAQTKAQVLAAAHVLVDGDRVLQGSPRIFDNPNVTSKLLLHAELAGQLPHSTLLPADIVAAQSKLDISLSETPLFPQRLLSPPLRAHESCTSAELIPVSVPKGGGSIVLESSSSLNLGVTLHARSGLSGPRVTFAFPPGHRAVNISASGTSALLQASAAPGFIYCPIAPQA
jgi:hypothetical protein